MKAQQLLIILCILMTGCGKRQDLNRTGEIKVELTDSMLDRMRSTYFYLVTSPDKKVIDSVFVDKKIISFKAFNRSKKEPIKLKIMHYDLRKGGRYLLPLGFNFVATDRSVVYSLFYADETPTYIKANDFFHKEISYFVGATYNSDYFKSLIVK